MISSRSIFIFVLVVILLTACTTATESIPTATPTTSVPTALTTVTPTTVWFPPTATHTAFPTPMVTPTEDMSPKLGKILFSDDFSTEKGWTLTHTDAASVAYGKDELTIAIGETNAYVYSVREEPVFSDFYLEITANPNLCSGLDEYGVLFRVEQDKDSYRFTLSCDGQVRADRISGEEITSPQPWMYSGSVPPGAPSSSRLGVLAVGREMSFYVNGDYQFTIKDPLFYSGGIGIFARSVNKKAVTINFSDLVVYEVNP